MFDFIAFLSSSIWVQKYRLYLRRLSGSQHMGSMNGSSMDSPEAGYRSMSSVNGFDLQTMAGASQLPVPRFATLQAALLGRSNNIFSFENQKMQYGQVNKSQQLHGIPTNMGPNQFLGLHQSRQNSFNGVNNQVLLIIKYFRNEFAIEWWDCSKLQYVK